MCLVCRVSEGSEEGFFSWGAGVLGKGAGGVLGGGMSLERAMRARFWGVYRGAAA